MRSVSRAMMAAALAIVPLGCGDERPEALAKERATAGAGAPRLLALAERVEVRSAPAPDAGVLGSLTTGAVVTRSAEPVGLDGCADGWFEIEPRGFVCAGPHAAKTAELPVLRALRAPDRSLPLPYRYARARPGGAVAYRLLPGEAVQKMAEPYQAKRRRRPPENRRLGAGANDVPLGESGLPSGPPVIRPASAGVGEDGYRTRDRYFDFGELLDLEVGRGVWPLPRMRPIAEIVRRAVGDTDVLRRRTGLALVGAVELGEGAAARRFGVMTDGRLVPIDRLSPELGTSWHGIDVREVGLPVGFALRAGVKPRRMARGQAETIDDEEYMPRQAIPLTGRYRTVAGVRYYFTKNGRWVRHRDMIVAFNRHEFPDFAKGAQRWLDVSLANQTLVVYEGKKPVYATLISSGRDRLGDPEKGPSSPQGVFRVRAKRLSGEIDSREVDRRHRLLDVPWIVELDDGLSLCGGYWLDQYGEARGYHHIALAPIDARFVFQWLGPKLPAGWHTVEAGDDPEAGIVYVHR